MKFLTPLLLLLTVACGGGAITDPTDPGTPPAGAIVAKTVTTPNFTFSPKTVTITKGKAVAWKFSGDVHNVTFGTLKPTRGNIPDQKPGAIVTRTFPTVGTYRYKCTRHTGMTGKVVVQ